MKEVKENDISETIKLSKGLEDPDLICLSSTRLVERGQFPFKLYKREKELANLEKIEVSILNSIFTQRRAYFVITRRSLRELLGTDKNWSQMPSFSDGEYRKTLKAISGANVERFVKGKAWRPTVYKVINNDLLSLIGLTEEELKKQEEQALEFVSKKSDKLKSEPENAPSS